MEQKKDFYRTSSQSQNPNSAFRQFIRFVKRKSELIELKGGKCEICGYDKNISALDFHHIDPEQKKLSLNSRTLANAKREDILEEADKCMLLCANCHREIHYPNHEKNCVNELLTENAGMLREPKDRKFCIDCGKLLLAENKSGYCSVCIHKHRQKVERPSKEELTEMLQHASLNKIGKRYGVSHAAVRKWAIGYGIWER